MVDKKQFLWYNGRRIPSRQTERSYCCCFNGNLGADGNQTNQTEHKKRRISPSIRSLGLRTRRYTSQGRVLTRLGFPSRFGGHVHE